MTTVVGVLIDMYNNEPGDREVGNRLDEVAAPSGAAAVPMELGLADAQAFHGFTHVGHGVVFA